MKLSFKNGYFVIDVLPANLEREQRDRWENTGKQLCTTDLKAAMRFSQDADTAAKFELDRTRIRHYPFPSHVLPELSSLDSHQVRGVEWILTRSRSYLAQAPGAGKTIQAIVAANAVAGDTLIICPPLLVENWKREILKWGRGRIHCVAVRDEWWMPTSLNHQCADWVIFPDSLILSRAFITIAAHRWSFVIIDEASRFKEVSAQRTRKLFVESGLIQNSRHTVLLDGSPMMNRPMELWAPTYFTAPEAIDFQGQQEFGFRYCGPKMNEYGQWEFRGASRVEELREKLTQDFMQFVTEEELDHPERRRRILYMSEDVRTKSMRTWEERNSGTVEFTGEGVPRGDLAHHMQELGIRKARWAAQYIASRIDRGEQLLVFFWHREVGRQISKLLEKVSVTSYIDGSVPMALREKMFEMFQANKCPVILGNVQAMGRGVNLQAADRIIFVEYSWCDETNLQAEKRASRRGSTKSVIPCDYLCAPDSFDEVKLNVLFRKQKLVDRLTK